MPSARVRMSWPEYSHSRKCEPSNQQDSVILRSVQPVCNTVPPLSGRRGRVGQNRLRACNGAILC
ncbi:hypothetical protein OHAE_2299 [Ochrobactrum soli]|uniref:Uncharacterized protein n=1 Tax=Ochrobactrum soli TaxID=2448455 RepID=A0A2P9HQT0_9HYPH|nr:hypothetical protein OHAE_2299 [[Ochrobactrum] soli]